MRISDWSSDVCSSDLFFTTAQDSLPSGELSAIGYHMANQIQSLDSVFHALADPTRRAVISRLLDGAAPVKRLSEPFQMGLPAFLKHLSVLEASGLIHTEKQGRVRPCRLDADRKNV